MKKNWQECLRLAAKIWFIGIAFNTAFGTMVLCREIDEIAIFIKIGALYSFLFSVPVFLAIFLMLLLFYFRRVPPSVAIKILLLIAVPLTMVMLFSFLREFGVGDIALYITGGMSAVAAILLQTKSIRRLLTDPEIITQKLNNES